MVDENVGAIPISDEDKIIVELKVIDAKKAWDILGKLSMNRRDLKKYGLEFNLLYPWEDKFKNNIKDDLRNEIVLKLNDTINDIDKMLAD